MRHVGFSTGAVAGGDFSSALTLLASQPGIDSIELSALRLTEVEPLLRAIPSMDLNRYSYISFHAPSSFPAEEEASLVAALTQFYAISPRLKQNSVAGSNSGPIRLALSNSNTFRCSAPIFVKSGLRRPSRIAIARSSCERCWKK